MADTVITGNLTADPVLRHTASGKAVASFRVCENRRRRTADGWEDDAPLFLNVVAWADLGEHVAAAAKRGTRVTVRGRLVPADYEKDGATVRAFEVVADDVALSLRFGAPGGGRRLAAVGGGEDPWATSGTAATG